nr:retrovirus-related Pol polyprotein from transposon TNT 1-94 [Tanacetum cinerariifolium]
MQNSKSNMNSDLHCVTCNGCLFSNNHDSCVLKFINNVNARVKSKSVKRKIWKPTRKVFTNIGHIWRPTGRTFTIVGNACPLTRITTTAKVPLRKPIAIESNPPKRVVTLVYSRKPKESRNNVSVSKSKINKSLSANKKEPNKSWGSIVANVPSSSIDECRKKYILVIVDDYSRFTWVKCLRSKDEAPNFIIKFLKMIQVRLKVPVRHIRTDNGTEYVNQTLREYYEQDGISHERSVARSPQQNGVVERHNRMLIEATRTIQIIETIHVDFDELTAMASEQISSGLALHEMTPATISSGLMPKPTSSTPVDHPALEVITSIAEVVAPETAESTGSPSSTTVDQDVPSPSKSQTTPKTQPPIIPNDVEEDNHDIKVAHMGNDSFFVDLQSKARRTRRYSKEQGSVSGSWLPSRGGDFEESFAPVARLEAKDFSRVFRSQEHGRVPNGCEDCIFECLRGIFINQSKYALESLKKYGFESCDPVDTPMMEKSKLDKDKEEKDVDPSHYRGMIGTLFYLTANRPDLQFAICMCAQYQARPTKKHLHAAKRIFRYLRGTINRGLWYLKDSLIALTTFADADHAGCQDTRRSIFGSLQFLRDRLISWSSKWKKSDPISSTEAEYIALSGCCAQILWTRSQLTDFGLGFNKIPMNCDNKSATALCCNNVQHSRSKHIDIIYYIIKEHVENGVSEIYFVNTKYQLADIFTKALGRERIEFLINKMGMRSFTPKTLQQLTDEVDE